ncbi:unnamed protein product [Nezara viridula]|uniref:Uncharacterized protein n=1 Tax=Nezara viridula TaxID=85310 RepID=A0A9P0HUC1_NEZVI|nr:unnamed protein product [Nezara viridula]
MLSNDFFSLSKEHRMTYETLMGPQRVTATDQTFLRPVVIEFRSSPERIMDTESLFSLLLRLTVRDRIRRRDSLACSSPVSRLHALARSNPDNTTQQERGLLPFPYNHTGLFPSLIPPFLPFPVIISLSGTSVSISIPYF